MRPYLSIALLFLAACGGSDPKALTGEGYAALGKGDAKSALTKFDEALKGLETTNPEYLRAALGRCEALARNDGPGAKKAFLDLAKQLPEKVREDDYSLVCAGLIQGGFTVDAVDVMDAGNQRFKGSKKMKETLDAVMNAAKRASTPEALKKLASLGYT